MYPFMDSKTVSIKQRNFDFDIDGEIKLVTSVKNGHGMYKSGNGRWAESVHQIRKDERNASVDIQLHKQSLGVNTITIHIKNQQDDSNIPLFAIPLGGVPKYEYDINIMYHR